MSDEWPFADDPNTSAIVDRRVLDRVAWIAVVFHEANDGRWQFVGTDFSGDESQVKVITLESVLSLDPTIRQLSDLPEGWCAWRNSASEAWLREAIEPFEE